MQNIRQIKENNHAESTAWQQPTVSHVPATPPALQQIWNEQHLQQDKAFSPVEDFPRRLPRRMPVWLTTVLVLLAFAAAGLFTAKYLISAYLVRCEEARQAAHQAVVEAHPIYFKDTIEEYAVENNLHPAFVEAIILNESSFRTNAESNIGARGLMQLMPDTAQWIAGKLDVTGYSFDRMWDAESNIRFGTWYLNYLSRLFGGDPVLVSCAYHAGQGTVTRWLSDPNMSTDGRTIPIDNLPDGPTKTYARRVTTDYAVYEALYYTEDEAADSGDADAVPAAV
ncbi:MAG: lytic transglycosylase domain-containing protein [Clostridia bacterium]|nr:lytic transglycosylase domain-containing protein [Clostridia bacterium]